MHSRRQVQIRQARLPCGGNLVCPNHLDIVLLQWLNCFCVHIFQMLLINLEFLDHHRDSSEKDDIAFSNNHAFFRQRFDSSLAVVHFFADVMLKTGLVGQQQPGLVR